jgi:hypothetical protein
VKLGFVYAFMWSLMYCVVSHPGGSHVLLVVSLVSRIRLELAAYTEWFPGC